LLLATAASTTTRAQSLLPKGDLCASVKIADIVQAAHDNPNMLSSAQGMLTSQFGTPKRVTMLPNGGMALTFDDPTNAAGNFERTIRLRVDMATGEIRINCRS
jgi:hypothetical protein